MRRSSLATLLVLAALPMLLDAAPAAAGKGAAASAPLPAIAQTPLAQSVRRGDRRIEKYRRQYLRRAAAGRLVPSRSKQKQEAALQERARAVGAAIAATGDTRPILVMLEGPDGAGKSGTIRRLKTAFDQLGSVREVHFGAPPDGETRHWLERYKDELPGAGETAIWDRSYYGRVVYDPYYGMADTPTVRDRYADIEALEASLARDYRIVKIYLDVGSDRLAQTIGKREATAPEKLQDSDYRTFRDRKTIRKLFRSAIKSTQAALDWHVVPMSDRDEGRDGVLEVLRDVLAPR
jgi:polyphosphate kinase 2 (PPK2 family)